MEDSIAQKLAESGATFALLGYCVWAVLGFLRTLVEHNTRMGEQLAKTNSDLAEALRESQRLRSEERQVHSEHTILLKMLIDKVSEKDG